MASVLEADPAVSRAVAQVRGSSAEERRRAPRERFPVIQRIAQATGEMVPDQTAFFSVKCQDLSTRGFSFLAKRRPQFKTIVLALATPSRPIYLAAEVRHCTDVLVHPSGQVEVVGDQGAQTGGGSPSDNRAQLSVLVGCEFTQRLEG